jgi:hypothetical protein
MQKYVPRNLLGRVNSVDSFGSWLVAPVAPILSAALISVSGPREIFLFGGAIAFAYWMVALAAVRSARQLR